MKTIFDKTTRDEVFSRIETLTESSKPQWGKMTAAQMVKHCSQWDEMALGKKQFKRMFIGRLFGKFALKDMMQDKPVQKNLSTVPSFKILEQPNFTAEKKKWLSLLDEYKDLGNAGFIHPFFGHLTREQTGLMVYKHIDHHLKQFNS